MMSQTTTQPLRVELACRPATDNKLRQASPIYEPLIALLSEVRACQHVFAQMQQAFARRHAPGFNAFNFLRTDELGLSEVIRWMLDPCGSHGQGDAFLRAFIDTFEIKRELAWATSVARCEVTTDMIEAAQRRIDVHVKCSGFVLAIENKPFALWQPQQVTDYLAHLKRSAPNGYCLVLLKGADDPLPESQLTRARVEKLKATGTLIDSNYSTVISWVQRCAQLCEAERVRSLLRDFADFLDHEFGSGSAMEEKELIVETARRSPERLNAALSLLSARGELLSAIHEDLVSEVTAVASSRGFDVDFGEGGRGQGIPATSFWMSITCDHRLDFCFIYDWAYGHKPWIGFWREKDTVPLPRGADARLARVFGPAGRPGGYWAWWRHLSDEELGVADASDFASVWAALDNRKTFAPKIVAWSEAAYRALKG